MLRRPLVSELRRVIVLRHGRTTWNAERRFQGQADAPLDDVGRSQAYEVAAIVAALRPSVLISSDLQRALHTAAPIADLAGLPVISEPRLRERSLGHWEGLTRDDVRTRFPDEFADWLASRDVSRRGGESRTQVAERALAVFRELPEVGVSVLVTHSATAMALAAAVLGLPQDVHVISPLANCHWTELVAEHGSDWRLKAHNVGAPGVIVPLPVAPETDIEDASDAEA
jgi:probable phosphoglycerate mutase